MVVGAMLCLTRSAPGPVLKDLTGWETHTHGAGEIFRQKN